jgi:hypothetical protein
MVERPIKKSERQAAEASDAVENAPKHNQELARHSPEERKPIPQSEKKERSKGKGKGKSDRSQGEPPKPVNLALMRGPKPTRPKKPLVVAEAPVSEGEEMLAEIADTDETQAPVVES